STPSADVNSVMISPHPPRLRINRRNTVSVTPAIGASTVAGAISIPPIETDEGTASVATACVETDCVETGDSPVGPELYHNFRTVRFSFPSSPCPSKTNPPPKRGPIFLFYQCKSVKIRGLLLRRSSPRRSRRVLLGILPPETLHPPRRIHQLLLAGKERMAVRADFHRDIALMGRPGNKRVAARAMHAHFMVIGMNSCHHSRSNLNANHSILLDGGRIQQPEQRSAISCQPSA